jgi:hypothetical protein
MRDVKKDYCTSILLKFGKMNPSRVWLPCCKGKTKITGRLCTVRLMGSYVEKHASKGDFRIIFSTKYMYATSIPILTCLPEKTL